MDSLVPILAALIASATAPTAAVGGGERAAHAWRDDGGSAATVTVSARIIGSSARVGAGHAPPWPRMTPRHTTVSAADGRAVPALVYDFE